jgi:hypothetical protein
MSWSTFFFSFFFSSRITLIGHFKLLVGQYYATVTIKKNYKIENIVLKSGPAWRVNPKLELDRVEKKQKKKKLSETRLTRRVDLTTWLTRQYPVKNLVATR